MASLLPLLGITAIAITACGGTSSAASTSTTTEATPVTTQVSVATTSEAASIPVEVAPDTPSPQAILDEAISNLGGSYLFSSEVVVDGVVASLAQGRNVGDATEVRLDQEDTSLIYRSIGDQRWVLVPDESWVQLADSTVSTSPLAGLDLPKSVALISTDNGVTILSAVYDPSVLSLSTPGDLTVTLTITNGVLTNLDYRDELADNVIELHSTMTPESDLEPILAP